MSRNGKPFYRGCFERIRDLRTIAPEKTREELRKGGGRLFYEAAEADDSRRRTANIPAPVGDTFKVKEQ